MSANKALIATMAISSVLLVGCGGSDESKAPTDSQSKIPSIVEGTIVVAQVEIQEDPITIESNGLLIIEK
ncbi:hypothetical protein [Vibrio sp.]|uniref:hypothetical protein n=1 Tax=Vibrio sp. TaxID=678 RepID=UPI003AA90C79